VHRHRHILTHHITVLQAKVQQQCYSYRGGFATL
jgi:hypothetical protein